jgi:DNA-binding SARP family transcriptional activator/predicted negative regulator of RcsB-dependent stress response
MLEQEQALVRIYILGQFRLERRASRATQEWETVTDSAWQHQRVRALLGCLVGNTARKLGREQIMDTLWPDLDLETAASRLDRAVYSLRQLFEPARNRTATSSFLLTEREMLVLASQSDVWIDADAFEQLLTHAHEIDDLSEKERLLEEAAKLYGGDLLPEERRVEWTLVRRESLQRSWIGLMLDLADLRAGRDALTSAIEPLDRLLSVDPTNEAAVQRLMKLLEQLERRGEALRAYKRLASVLQQEYRIAPLPETRVLYEALRSGRGTQSVSKLPASVQTQGETRRESRPDAISVLQIGRSHQSPLVGRVEELNLLRSVVTATEHAARFRLSSQRKTSLSPFDTQRRPQCVLVLGDVGIGKTRLAEEVSRDAKRNKWAVAWSRVYAQEGSIPYRLWTEVLRKAMDQGAWQRNEINRRPLVFQPLSALLPELHDYLPPVGFPSTQPPEQEQLRLWEATRELLTLISESTPLLIALDDLQWADNSSCELLAYLARRIHGHPIVIVGTCRDNELPSQHALRSLLTDLQREHAVDTISLQPLNDEQISTLVSHISPHVPPHIAQSLVKSIRARAAGNPFFAEELARTIGAHLAAIATSPNGNGQISTLINANGETILPDTITAVLDLRLGRLSPPCLRLLSKAAVLGGSFEFQIINAMEVINSASDEDIVLDLLEEALRSGMLTEEGSGTRITYQFWHPLLADHLYEKLSAARRASLHRRAAEVFQRLSQGREEEGAATITHHLLHGGADAHKIAHYAELAGNRAYSLSSYPEAEKYHRIAIEHIDKDSSNRLHYPYLLECVGESTKVQGKYNEARSLYEQALEVHSQSSSPLTSQQEAQLQAMLLCEIGATWYDMGNLIKAREYCRAGEQVLQNAGVVAGPVWAQLRLRQSYISWHEGSYNDARHTAQEALALFSAAIEQRKQSVEATTPLTRIRRTLAGDPVDIGRTHGLLGLILTYCGEGADALAHLNTALAIYEQYDHQREIAVVCCNLGNAHLARTEYSEAKAFFRRSLGLAERIGEAPLISFVFGNLGVIDTRLGHLADAEAGLKHCISIAERSNALTAASLWYACLANTLQEQGKLSEANAALYRALTISRTKQITPYLGIALLMLGKVRITQAISIAFNQREGMNSHQILNRAKRTLQRALALEGIDADTKTDEQLTLAQVFLLLGELDGAQKLATQALEEAHQFELTWFVVWAQRLLGTILAKQNQPDEAEKYFEQALRMSRKYETRLEYARTLYQYGLMLLQQNESGEQKYQQGADYLREARQVFSNCHAALDLQLVEQALDDNQTMKRE